MPRPTPTRITTAQAARELGISSVRVLQLIAADRLPAEKIHPRLYLINRADLARVRNRPAGWKKGRPRARRKIVK